MWPFRSNPVKQEWLELGQKMSDLEQRFKVLEREHDDLHAAYRRLRGARAVEARDTPKVYNREAPAEGERGEPERPFSKDELRRKYLVVGTRKARELPLEDS